MLKYIENYTEFSKRVGKLLDLAYTHGITDIEPSTLTGFFTPDRLEELRAYCQANPQFHIITMQKGPTYTNTALEHNVGCYLLANGDSDPSLIHRPKDFNLDIDEIVELAHTLRDQLMSSDSIEL